MRENLQRFGGFLAGMVIPNIAAFIAWGLITALFIPTGWLPNEGLPEGRPRLGADESRKEGLPVLADRPRPALPLPADGRLLSLLCIKWILNRQRYAFVECQFL